MRKVIVMPFYFRIKGMKLFCLGIQQSFVAIELYVWGMCAHLQACVYLCLAHLPMGTHPYVYCIVVESMLLYVRAEFSLGVSTEELWPRASFSSGILKNGLSLSPSC